VAESYNGYCVKCKEKRDFDGEVKVSESGRRMAQGTCPVCGTKMNRILGKACAPERIDGGAPMRGRRRRRSAPCPPLWTATAPRVAALPPCPGE
jgi:hypothetical protein